MRGTVAALTLTLWAGQAQAHASHQGFVLLLPTDIYIAAGVACVAMTVLLLVVLPENMLDWLSRPFVLSIRRVRVRHWVSAISALLLIGILVIGYLGPRDPMKNPLPLTIWVVWWIGLVTIQGIVWSSLLLTRDDCAPLILSTLPKGFGLRACDCGGRRICRVPDG